MNVKNLFSQNNIVLQNNLIILDKKSKFINQNQTNKIFSDKWKEVNTNNESVQKLAKFQFDWYLSLYGFKDEKDLAKFLKTKEIILDAGCGLGYKAAWFAKLSPESTVIGMDLSDSAYYAANRYRKLRNLYFVQADIANTRLKKGSVDYVSCDQVIHHTENPEKTFRHLTSI